MKTLSAAIATAILALGLAGNAMAAPSHSDDLRLKQANQGKHQVVKQQTKKVVVQQKGPAKKVVIKVVTKKAAPQSKHASNKTYRVRAGDTLASIAARNRVSLNKLIQINKLWGNKANNLRVGMTIRLG